MNPGLKAAIVQVNNAMADVDSWKHRWETALAKKKQIELSIQVCHDGWNNAIATQNRAERALERHYEVEQP